MVKLYKTSGDSNVFPEVSQPFSSEMVKAINHCMTILGFYENITDPDHMPPEYLWPFDDEITKWFDSIREETNSGGSDVREVAVDNELAERFR